MAKYRIKARGLEWMPQYKWLCFWFDLWKFSVPLEHAKYIIERDIIIQKRKHEVVNYNGN